MNENDARPNPYEVAMDSLRGHLRYPTLCTAYAPLRLDSRFIGPVREKLAEHQSAAAATDPEMATLYARAVYCLTLKEDPSLEPFCWVLTRFRMGW